MKISIPVSSHCKGFVASMGEEFARRGHEVKYIFWNENVRRALCSILTDLREDDYRVVCSTPLRPIEDLAAELRACEQRYGETFSMLASYDRALGKGYLFNVDFHPDIIRAYWPKFRKYQEILTEIMAWEDILDTQRPDVIVSCNNYPLLYLVADGRRIPYLLLNAPRIGKYFNWTDTVRYRNTDMFERVRHHVKAVSQTRKFSKPVLHQAEVTQKLQRLQRYSYAHALKEAFCSFVRETGQMIKRNHRSITIQSHRYLAAIWPLLNKPRIFNYLCRYGMTSAQVKERGEYIILFPLHVEPESTLSIMAAEMTNSLEYLTWVSKSAPVDATIVVKEHPGCFGMRSLHFYKNLRRIPNVVLAHPGEHSTAWLRTADMVATISGTMGFEAVYEGKPVLSAGKHQVINELPTVRYVDNYESTYRGLHELLALAPGDVLYEVSREALERGTADVSFSLDGFEKTLASMERVPELAVKTVDHFFQMFGPRLEAKTQGQDGPWRDNV